jgi:thiosulfate/3-mercaptopyruvate sulfurtransferase
MAPQIHSRESALVDPAWLAAHRDDSDVCVIEIAGMGPDDLQVYGKGHVPGAYSRPWQEFLWDAHQREFPSPQEFARRLGAAGIGNDTTVVFYGEGVQFGFYAWWVFRYCGHRNVRILDGARYRWAAEGRELTTIEPAARHPVAYEPVARVEQMRIGYSHILQALGQPGKAILDARSAEEYAGLRVGAPGSPDTGAVRYGRIPGAQHLYFEDLLDANKAFKPAGELQRMLRERGVEPGREVIAYCRMSHRATVLYFALTELLGHREVRLYDGSWTEWGNLVGAPIEREDARHSPMKR